MKKIISLILCTFLALSPALTIAEKQKPILENGEAAKLLVEQCANLIITQYKDEVSRFELYEETLMSIMEKHPELIEEAYTAMLGSLDDHTCYYNEEEYKYFTDSMSGEFSGIGVMISELPDGLLVTGTTSESPAGKAGVIQGDIIISADGISIVGMPLEKAKTFIVGEAGTTVKIGVLRRGQYLEFTIVRQPVIVEPGSYQIINNSTGYIALHTFDGSAHILVNNALDAFDSLGITDVIFDLRYNPGGEVNALMDIAQRTIPEGPVIHFEYQDPEESETLYSLCKKPKYNLIVLVNEYSASASEAFAGAVQDSGVGFVLGDTTYGKGTMQTLINFRIGGGAKLTVAEYLTRNKRRIDGEGITPNFREKDDVVTIEDANFNSFDFKTKLKFGDEGPEVLALNQRLWALGYDIGIPTDEFTKETENYVYHFQRTNGLYPYGVCDITTQNSIENVVGEIEFLNNDCFETALEIFEKGEFKKYVGKYY